MLVGVCYRTRTKQVYGKMNHTKLREMMKKVLNNSFVLMGDFNFSGIDWNNSLCESTASEDCRLFLQWILFCAMLLGSFSDHSGPSA